MLTKVAVIFLAVMVGLALFLRARAARAQSCPRCGKPLTQCRCKG